jgi:hypothetical protein
MIEERAQRNDSKGSDGHKGSMSDMNSRLHHSNTLCQRGRYYSYEGRESNQRLRNTNPCQRHLDRGNIPKGRYHFPLMLKGER